MIKSALIAGVLLTSASAAHAGVYANVEANSSFQDGEYGSTRIDEHIGYASDLGDSASWYVQAGPSQVSRDGEGTEYQAGGKIGVKTELGENLDGYAELKGYTGNDYDFEDIKLSVKAGVKYYF